MRLRSAAISLLVASLVFLPAAEAKTKERSKNDRWEPAQVLVKYKSGFAPEIGKHKVKKAKKLFGQFKLKGKAQHHAAARGLDRIYLIDLESDSVEETLAALAKDPAVEYAEPNWRIELSAVPNDPAYETQWALAKIGAPQAWDTTTTGNSVVVGVVDTGIDLTHPDLVNNLWTNPGEIAGNGADDDGNGFVDDIHGWDFFTNDNDPSDTHGHGTRVAGIIGAVGNNATGVCGVAWNGRLAALRIGSSYVSVASAAQAIEYANMMGFKITNNSWGWWEGGQSFLMDDVVNAAEAAGHLFIVSAGNDAKDNDVLPTYPAHYTNSNVISVTATTMTDGLSSYANWGATSVDLGAPGDRIDSTTIGGYYAVGDGTSFAAPFVAGAAALYWTANPTATHVQVRDEILYSSEPVPSLHGRSVSGGRLSLSNLFDAEATAPAAVTDLTVIDTTFRSVVIRFTSTGDDGNAGTATRYDVRVSTSPITPANFASATQLIGEPAPQDPGNLETFKLSGLDPNTSYYIAARVFDNAGNGSALSNAATFTTGRAAVIFDDNVEGGPRAWFVEGTNGTGGPALWHTAPQYGRSQVWSYSKAGGYGYDTGAANWGALMMPELNLTEARDARLRFSQSVWTERHFGVDMAQVQISVGGGPWNTVMSKMFTNEWVNESIDLSAYYGHHIRIRFFFDTIDAASNDYPGWQIDDIIIEASSQNTPPVANVNGPYSVNEDSSIVLSAAGSFDPDGAPLEFKWDFGDGMFNYTTRPDMVHMWTLPGTYTMTLTAYDGSNSSEPVTTTVSVSPVNDRPYAHIEMGFTTPPYLEETNIGVSWIGSSDEEGSPLTCHFDYGDGTRVDRPCEGAWPHSWNQPGTYTITLVVNDGELDSYPAIQPITILENSNDKPIARAGGPYDGRVNETVTLDGSASSDEETSIASYLWTFPDGSTATVANPQKTFTAAGTYNVTLVVTDATGLASQPATTQVRVCGGANVELFGGTNYTCPGGTIDVGVNVRSGVLPLTLTWSDGYVQQITSLSNGYYAKRTVTPAERTTYALSSVTDFLGCSGTVGTTPTIIDFASATLFTTETLSGPGQQQSIEPDLKGDAPWTLTWSDGYVQNIPINGERRRFVAPTETTTYSITSATCASCPSGTSPLISGSRTIRIIDPPVATVSGGGASCNGAPVAITVTITAGQAPYTITWSDGVTNGTSNSSLTRNVSPSSATTYTVTRISSGSATGTSSGSATVTPETRPTAVVSGGGAFCAGSEGVTITATLTGTAPFSIVWSDGVTQQASTNTATRTVNPSTTTTYTITSLSNASCSGTASGSAVATRRATPTATVSGGGNYCEGSTATIEATLTGTAPFNVTWSDGVTQTISSGNVASRQVAPAGITVYNVTSISDAFCAGTPAGSATVTPRSAPAAMVSGGGAYCEGSNATIEATLSGAAPFNVTWSDGATQTITSGNTASRQVGPSTETTYTIVSLSDAYCAGAATGNAVATPRALPAASVSGGGNFCEGGSTTITASLTGTAPFNVTWSDGVVQNIASGTTATRQVSPASATTYTVTAISDAYCAGTSTGSAVTTPRATPAASVSGGGDFCAGGSTTINASLTGTAPFNVTWSDGVVQNIASGTTAARQVSPASATTYTVTAISDAYCAGTSTGSAVATPRATPAASVSGGGNFCAGGSTTITASLTGAAPFSVTWSDGVVQTITSGTTATRQASPTSATSYTVTAISDAYCAGTSTGSAVATPRATPAASVSGGGNFCAGSQSTITATLTGAAPFSVTWSDGVVQTITSGNTASRQVAPASATTYTVTAISDAYCAGTSTGSAVVTQRNVPTAAVSGGGNYCEGSSSAVTATLSGIAPFNVTWSDGVVQTITSGTTATRQVTPAATTIYTVTTLSDAYCGGTSSGSATVSRITRPVITVQPASKTIKSNQSTTLSVSTTETGLNYQWYQGPSGTTTTPVGTNSYSFTTPRLRSTTQYWVKIWKSGCASYPTNSQTATVTVK